jgi:molybdopterin-guanine dinucleotide biosynthesis protein A
MHKFTVAIMAGGKSSRMGSDKSFVRLLNKPLIEHVMERVSDLGQDETLLITNRPADYAHLKLPIYTDLLPDKGSLGGIYTAIYYSRNEYTLVVACDMPFVNPKLLRHMIGLLSEQDGPFDVVAPRVDGYPEGLHAIYGKACLSPIRKQLELGQFKVIGFYPEVRARYLDEAECMPIDPKGHSFLNVNTPEEIRWAEEMVNTG